MGYYDGSALAMWQVARRYTLADNFFMGAFGGSFLNHQYLVCACAPEYPNADALAGQGPRSARSRPTRAAACVSSPAADAREQRARRRRRAIAATATLTPKDARGMFYAVNTMQPPYQPSGDAPPRRRRPALRRPGRGDDAAAADAATIGDRLDAKGVSWAWYGGAWKAASAGTPEARAIIYKGTVQFQPHHQPFNYYAAFDPATHARLSRRAPEGLRQRVPRRCRRRPAARGHVLQAAGQPEPASGLRATSRSATRTSPSVVAALEKSPQWPHMLVVVTYDENGGFWDHVPVPKGDRWGPATRVPAIIVSPFAKKGFVDKTPYDTGSILRFITRRWNLAPLPGVELRDRALVANGQPPMGDLSAALEAPR